MARRNPKSKTQGAPHTVIRNHLWLYRKRMGFSQKHIAWLLGHRSAAHISDYERGKRFPCLETALKLEIILRVPAAFLYKALYSRLKQEIRQLEEKKLHSKSNEKRQHH